MSDLLGEHKDNYKGFAAFRELTSALLGSLTTQMTSYNTGGGRCAGPATRTKGDGSPKGGAAMSAGATEALRPLR